MNTILPGRSCASICLAASRAQKLDFRDEKKGKKEEDFVSLGYSNMGKLKDWGEMLGVGKRLGGLMRGDVWSMGSLRFAVDGERLIESGK